MKTLFLLAVLALMNVTAQAGGFGVGGRSGTGPGADGVGGGGPGLSGGHDIVPRAIHGTGP
jgi:hypothetical protein